MISEEPPADAVAPLPLWPAVAETYRTIFTNGVGLVRVVALPAALGLVLDVVVYAVAPPWSGLLRLFLYNLLWAAFLTGWLSFLLLGDRAALRVFPRLNRKLARLAGYALLFALLDVPMMLGWYFFGGMALDIPHYEVVYWLTYLVTAFVKLRIAFIFPAAVADERYSPILAWRHSGRIALPLFVAAAITVFLPIIALQYGIGMADAEDPLIAVSAWIFWQGAVWFLEATYITMVAIAFRRCTGWVPAPDRSILERFE